MTLALLKTAYEKFFQLKVSFKINSFYLLFTDTLMMNFPARTIESKVDKVQRGQHLPFFDSQRGQFFYPERGQKQTLST